MERKVVFIKILLRWKNNSRFFFNFLNLVYIFFNLGVLFLLFFLCGCVFEFFYVVSFLIYKVYIFIVRKFFFILELKLEIIGLGKIFYIF